MKTRIYAAPAVKGLKQNVSHSLFIQVSIPYEWSSKLITPAKKPHNAKVCL